jgi:hypothetical protein
MFKEIKGSFFVGNEGGKADDNMAAFPRTWQDESILVEVSAESVDAPDAEDGNFLETASTAGLSTADDACVNDEVTHVLATYSAKIRFLSSQNCDKDAKVSFSKMKIFVRGEPCDFPDIISPLEKAKAEYAEAEAKAKAEKMRTWERKAPVYKPKKKLEPDTRNDGEDEDGDLPAAAAPLAVKPDAKPACSTNPKFSFASTKPHNGHNLCWDTKARATGWDEGTSYDGTHWCFDGVALGAHQSCLTGPAAGAKLLPENVCQSRATSERGSKVWCRCNNGGQKFTSQDGCNDQNKGGAGCAWDDNEKVCASKTPASGSASEDATKAPASDV